MALSQKSGFKTKFGLKSGERNRREERRGEEEEEEEKKRREVQAKQAKVWNFGFLYGNSPWL